MKQTYAIMLVDDDPIFCHLFTKLLEHYPNALLKTSVFKNGEEALQYFRMHQHEQISLPDVIFVDINMPIISGWELMDFLQSESMELIQKIPIYILSSSISLSDKHKINDYSFINDYLTKPIFKKELFEVIDKCLSGLLPHR
ncbi:response regulator [Sphingobacterium alkalisoli]|uniref:Response regulator n=1 Tax=Sphingobacterium alkalisoli TaxID=1874115 RepID=A0A4U0GXP4_9SPHI|nr:response regulator [Sphingobacterium alkalisoli]TJY63961.1 response regulator [Sphingobacterium alkalisoli]GGH23778.1 response regulator [Sphingobacterium alkalisoli]